MGCRGWRTTAECGLLGKRYLPRTRLPAATPPASNISMLSINWKAGADTVIINYPFSVFVPAMYGYIVGLRLH